MRIGIDASMVDSNKAGIGYYAYSLIEALSTIDKKNEYYLFTYNRNLLEDLKLSDNFRVIEIAGTGNLKWMLKCLPSIWKLKLDKFLSPSNLFWGCVLSNCTTVIHDIAQIARPEFFRKKGNLLYRLELRILLRRKGLVIVPSKSVETELRKYFSNIRPKVTLISEGLHEWVFTPSNDSNKEEIMHKYGLPGEYILFVGTLEPRKNIESLIRGFKEFLNRRPGYKLVIAGKKGWFYESIFKLVEELNLKDSVIFLGYVPDNDLPYIYDLSRFVVNLSFYEGFGLPLIEANARNKAVLASNIGVYNELNIQGEYIDPNASSIEIAAAMERLVEFENVNSSSIIATYSWKSAAQRLLNEWGE